MTYSSRRRNMDPTYAGEAHAHPVDFRALGWNRTSVSALQERCLNHWATRARKPTVCAPVFLERSYDANASRLTNLHDLLVYPRPSVDAG